MLDIKKTWSGGSSEGIQQCHDVDHVVMLVFQYCSLDMGSGNEGGHAASRCEMVQKIGGSIEWGDRD